jgi:hypothetical protein
VVVQVDAPERVPTDEPHVVVALARDAQVPTLRGIVLHEREPAVRVAAEAARDAQELVGRARGAASRSVRSRAGSWSRADRRINLIEKLIFWTGSPISRLAPVPTDDYFVN